MPARPPLVGVEWVGRSHGGGAMAERTKANGGFGTVDDKGRVALPKPLRSALGIEPGSAVAYVLLDGAVLLVPQDEQLTELGRRAGEVLSAVGLTVRDLLDELPAVRAAIVAE